MFLGLAVPAGAQSINATTYPFFSSTGATLEDMSASTTQLIAANSDDNASTVTDIGFDFWFGGTRYTQFSVNANGLMRLGSLVVGGNFVNDLTSSTNVPQIAPYWDELMVGTNGKVHWRVAGSAPNRKLVVEWLNMQVPRVGSGNAGAATFQCWLSETTGAVEIVYGEGMATNATNGGATIGVGSSASQFASVTSAGPTVSYIVSNNANVAPIASGTRYALAPPTPAAPTNLAFTGVTATTMTLNWTDNASAEVGYAVYRSLDGVTYTYLTQLPANTTSYPQAGLDQSTTYWWIVRAVGEGALSATLAGSQPTTAPGMITTSGSGNWSSTVPDAPWPGGVVPTASDDVTIADGTSVIVDVAASCLSLTAGQGSSGRIEFEATSARTLTVGGSLS
ncbi:MAG TPA: fibronectin type III domain-containing protein, partial [Candidatus Eisenbacteria bacterium]